MARKRQTWESLSENHRKRLSRHGLTKASYEAGASVTAARGHGNTPEHGLKSAKPGKHDEYIRKRTKPSGVPVKTVLDAARDAAYLNIHARLSTYYKYNRKTVLANVYGGTTSESGVVPGMTLQEAKWSSNAIEDQLREAATPQQDKNPWYYH